MYYLRGAYLNAAQNLRARGRVKHVFIHPRLRISTYVDQGEYPATNTNAERILCRYSFSPKHQLINYGKKRTAGTAEKNYERLQA